MRRHRALIASTLAVAVLFAGCGDDDDSADDGGDTTEETTTEAADESSDSTDGTDDTTDEGDAEDTTASDPDDTQPEDTDPPAEDADAFCAAYDSFNDLANDLPSDTLDDLRTGTATLSEELEGVREVAPEELTDDIDLLLDALAQLEQIATDADTVEEAQESYADAFSSEDTQNAADALDSYFGASCPQADDEQAPAEGE